MDKIRVHKGWLKSSRDEEDYEEDYHETLLLNGVPIAEELDYMSGKIVTVRYYISDKEATEEELQEDFLINTLYGNLESEYGAVYNETTGYLWTDDELIVGGHNLRSELESYINKYLYLIVEVDEDAEKVREIESQKHMYALTLSKLIVLGKNLNKDFDDIIQDVKKYFD